MKRTIIVALGCAAVLLAPATTLAGRNDSVDPAIMQPGLNQAFAPWDCWRTGAGIVCEGDLSISWSNEPSFFACDGRQVYSTGTDVRTQTRNGDADGLALSTRVRVVVDELLTLEPDGSGPAIRAFGYMTQYYEYGVPGDISTRTQRFTGVDVHVTAPSVGLILHDTGLKVFDIEDNVLLAHGPHPLLVDFDGAFQRVCDAFKELGA